MECCHLCVRRQNKKPEKKKKREEEEVEVGRAGKGKQQTTHASCLKFGDQRRQTLSSFF